MGDAGRAAGDVVRENIVANVNSGLGRRTDRERRGKQTCCRGTRMRAKKVNRVVIDLMSGSGTKSDSNHAKIRPERRTAGHIVVDVTDEVVLDHVVITGGNVYTKRAESTCIVVLDVRNVISLDRNSRAACSDTANSR